jgi:PAP_fibrillin
MSLQLPFKRLLLVPFCCICICAATSVAFTCTSTSSTRASTSTSTSTTYKYSYPAIKSPMFSSPQGDNNEEDKDVVQRLKKELLSALTNQILQERDGGFTNLNWGSKGGELTEAGRVPRQVDYSLISPAVGAAASQVLAICDRLQRVSPPPTTIPTQYLGDRQRGDLAPLNGAWKLLFSNAADAVFSKDSKRGAAKTQNIVDAKRGKITNVIDFQTLPDGTEPVLKQLQVIIKATALNAQRVQLDFQYAKVKLTKFFFLPLFGRTLTLYIPVPAAFITACIEFFQRIRQWVLRRKAKGEKRTARGYFDVLFLDDQLRVHKTGQGNMFVQAKADNWLEAQPLIR